MVASEPLELVVYDEPGTCSYLPHQQWRLPLRLPVRLLTREEFGIRLEDIVILREDGPEILSDLPRTLKVI